MRERLRGASNSERFENQKVRHVAWTALGRSSRADGHRGIIVLKILAVLAICSPASVSASGQSGTGSVSASAQAARASVTTIVAQIQRADYEDNRPELKRLFDKLAPFADDKELASRVRYWRGFALWRKALNGFNDAVDPKEIEADLNGGVDEFSISAAKDPEFVDAMTGAISCLSNLLYLNQKDPARVQELLAKAQPFVKNAKATDPENPRLLWVLGANIWNAPPERGGGQEKAIENDLKALEEARKRKGAVADALDPSWGEPELLMSLAWMNQHRATPDLNTADKHARSALALVPYWHYVRDILIPQIQNAIAAKAKNP